MLGESPAFTRPCSQVPKNGLHVPSATSGWGCRCGVRRTPSNPPHQCLEHRPLLPAPASQLPELAPPLHQSQNLGASPPTFQPPPIAPSWSPLQAFPPKARPEASHSLQQASSGLPLPSQFSVVNPALNHRGTCARQLFHTPPPGFPESVEHAARTSVGKAIALYPAHGFSGSGTRRTQRDSLPLLRHIWGITWEDVEAGVT